MGVTAHSTWKFNVPHSFGVHHALAPYPYRGPWGYDDPDAGRKYADDVKQLIDYATPGKVAGFIAESIQGVGGFVEFPQGYLKHAYEYVRAAGGVCIADEVQTGFGRTGTHFWGFETQGVIPDIVTMAKGIGNGCPLAAVVTTHKIAQSLVGKVHFNTFGGNPVVSAMGKAVLEVIEKENLQANALKLGNYILAGLNKLKEKHKIIGDVRGKGLMLGIEMVKDRATKAPASAECAQVVETAQRPRLAHRQRRLVGSDHPLRAADVHHAGRCGFPAGRLRRGIFKLVIAREKRHLTNWNSSSARGLRQGLRQNPHARFNLFRRGKFVRAVADAFAAGNENHRAWAKLRHEQRVVIRAADHFRV